MKPYFLIPLLMLSACQKDETISGQTGTDGTWVLQSIEDERISAGITIEFPKQGEIRGKAPCNQYFAAQLAPLPWFNVSDIGATKRACPQLALESRYFQALTQATVAEVQGDTLILSNDNYVVLTFKRF